MSFIDQIFNAPGYFDLPQGFDGWFIFALMIIGNIYLAIRWHQFDKPMNRMTMMLLIVLAVSTVLTSLVVGLHIPATDNMPVPGKTLLPTGATLMFFSALPWC